MPVDNVGKMYFCCSRSNKIIQFLPFFYKCPQRLNLVSLTKPFYFQSVVARIFILSTRVLMLVGVVRLVPSFTSLKLFLHILQSVRWFRSRHFGFGHAVLGFFKNKKPIKPAIHLLQPFWSIRTVPDQMHEILERTLHFSTRPPPFLQCRCYLKCFCSNSNLGIFLFLFLEGFFVTTIFFNFQTSKIFSSIFPRL